MKIGGVTLCYNEADMVKYVMPYWERIGIDKLIVYDNMSTDNTVELLKKYPFVEVREYDTGGKFNDRQNSLTKDAAIKEMRKQGYDWIYSGDFDEVIYSFNPDFREELQKIEDLGGNALCRDMIQPFTLDEDFKFDPTKLIHEQQNTYVTWHDLTYKWSGSKMLMHNAKQIKHIHYGDGQHEVHFNKTDKVVYFGYPFLTFHLKFVDLSTLERNSIAKNDRMKWRIEKAPNETTRKYLVKLYGKTLGSDKMSKMKNTLIARATKFDTLSWESMLERYNTYDFMVNRTKYIDKDKGLHQLVYRLDYNNINMDIFYKC